MTEIILVTPSELREILKQCLADQNQTNQASPRPEDPKYLHSLKELATFLGCSIVSAQKLKNSGVIRYKQFGRKLVFSTAEILEDLNKKQKKS